MTHFVSGQLHTVKKDHPGAYKIVRVEGGYMVFDWATDYATWKNQK